MENRLISVLRSYTVIVPVMIIVRADSPYPSTMIIIGCNVDANVSKAHIPGLGKNNNYGLTPYDCPLSYSRYGVYHLLNSITCDTIMAELYNLNCFEVSEQIITGILTNPHQYPP